MENFLNYLLEVSIIFSLFYGLYLLLIDGKSAFQINRIYLLLIYPLSLAIPLISIDVFPIYLEAITSNSSPSTTITPEITSQVITPTWTFNNILGLIYLFGVSFTGIFFARNLIHIVQLIRNSKKEKLQSYTIVLSKQVKSHSSFFNYIFNSPRLPLDENILEHETVHIKQLHTADILISEFVKILLWFHPLSWFMTTKIKLNHEYICDRIVAKKSDVYTYASLLSQYASTTQTSTLVNYFAYQLKKRIIMLSKNQEKKSSPFYYFALLPLIAIIFGSFTFDNYYVPVSSKVLIQDTIKPIIIKDTIISINPDTYEEQITIIETPIKEKFVIDTVTTFNSETYEETVQVIKNKVQLVEVIDTIITFDYDTYEETVQIVKTDMPLEDYISERQRLEQYRNPNTAKNTSDCILLELGSKIITLSETKQNISIEKSILVKLLKQEISIVSIKDCKEVKNFSFSISLLSSDYTEINSNMLTQRKKQVEGIDFNQLKNGSLIYIRNILVNGETSKKLGPIIITVI
jgi:beta-lactamase regulating signal transducer with metallopeptidase domain